MLEEKLNYIFKDKELLENALRHRSVGKNSNERLEFLGDAILGFVITSILYKHYSMLREGDLSRLRSNLVRKEALADLAKDFELGEHLILGAGEKKSGGFRRDSILADAVEAIIGAIYLDSDINICKDVVLKWYAKKLVALDVKAQKDPKTKLQEFLQSKQLALPEYKVVKTEGAVHNITFFVECSVEGFDFVTEASGTSKQIAEQKAAEKFLAKLK